MNFILRNLATILFAVLVLYVAMLNDVGCNYLQKNLYIGPLPNSMFIQPLGFDYAFL